MSETTPHSARRPHKARADARREKRSVDTFRVSSRGFRRVFAKHFGEGNESVEAVAYHLAQVEAQLPNAREAIRLARYPGAGNRNPKRMALGLMENLSALESHLRRANDALQELARGSNGRSSAAEEE